MDNNLNVKVGMDTADLQVKRAILSAEMKAASKDLSDFAKQARATGMTDELKASMLGAASAVEQNRAAIRGVERDMKVASAAMASTTTMSGQQRFAFIQLGQQLNDVSTMYAMGAKGTQIFASQIGQVTGAVQMMAGEGTKLAAFMASGWGIGITTATAVLVPLVAKMWEQNTAIESVKLSSVGLHQTQQALAGVFDIQTGKIKSQTDATLALARAQIILAQAESRKNLAEARGNISDSQAAHARYGVTTEVGSPTIRAARARSGLSNESYQAFSYSVDKDVAAIGANFSAGKIGSSQAIDQLQKLHDAGRITTATLSKLSAAYANFAVETANQKTLGDAWTSLTAGQLNTGLMEEGKGKKGRTGKGGGGGGGSPITAMADELRASEYKIREDTGDWLADMGDLEVDFWQAKAAEAKKGSKLYGEIIDKLEAAQQAAGVRAAQQQRQIADSDTSTDLSLAKAGFGRRREAASFTFDRALADEAAAAEIGAAQRKRDALAAIAHEEARAEIAAIEAKAAARGKDVVAEVEAANQVRIINSNLKSQLAALDRQFTADHEREVEKRKAMDERAAQQTAQAWRGFNQQVLAAEGQLIQGFISGRQSMGRTLLQVGANLVVQEIQQDVRYWTERKLLQAQGLNVEQATSQKGILLHLLTAQRKTAITTAGLASETAATTAAEVARTTATQAGSTARQVVEQGAAKLTGAVASALAGKQIASQAAVGAAGAYASQAPIPIVGPMLGAAEAVLVQAAIMKFASLASFDRGTNYIPSDMLAQVHAGERIIPAADNRRLMEAVGEAGPRGSRGSGSQQGGGNTYHINISAIDAHSVKRWARENGAALAGGVQHAIRNGYRGG